MKTELNFKLINRLILLIMFILATLFLQHLGVISFFFEMLSLCVPFYIAFFISWLMRPLGIKISNKLKISKKSGNFIAIILNILGFVVLILIFLPTIIFQISSFSDKIPVFAEGVKETISELSAVLNYDSAAVSEYLTQYTEDIDYNKSLGYVLNSFGVVFSVFSNLFGAIFQIIFAYIISFYFINDIEKFFLRLLKQISKKNYNKNLQIAHEISDTLFGYTKGMFFVCCIVFVLVSLGAIILGLPSPLLLGLVAALFNVVPFVGPIIGGIPFFLVALSVDIKTAIFALIVIFGTQFIESNFLQPKIMSHLTNIKPTTVIMGLLVFGGLFGFWGVLLATPFLSAMAVILKHSKYDIKL